ncbi:hypothetical protein GBA52_024434 [Prunus armeniaca]|nr:hypothetical protein GBA52_024434 [Prunus armeniaca]
MVARAERLVYIMAEYGMGGQVSILGEICSYGILLLVEMFTGKRPRDDMFRDSLSIHQFNNAALPLQHPPQPIRDSYKLIYVQQIISSSMCNRL